MFDRARRSLFATLAATAATALVLTGISMIQPASPAAAAITGSGFNAGNIISDQLFYDSNAMTSLQIQAFLSAHEPSCQNGACLSVLQTAIASRPVSTSSSTGQTICNALAGGTMSAAELIYRVQVACGISAKVILVTLEKEQGLVSSTAPGQGALDRAMGMACPDTAPCAAYALGFANQVFLGTQQLKTYRAAQFARQPGIQLVQYNPNAGCGGTTINVQNYATAALYSYTPYQPNAAALANLYGTGDACSAYGNRNFWVYYTTWFGSTQGLPSADVAPGLFARDAAGNLLFYQGTAAGNWQPVQSIGVGWNSINLFFGGGEFTGDGHRDIIARDNAGDLWAYPTDGQGGFLTPEKIGSGWSGFTAIVGGYDFNGDGIPDIIARDAAGILWLYPGDGRGKLNARIQVGNGWGGFTALIAAGDFTGDGHADLIVRNAAGALLLYAGDGRGGWAGAQQIGTGWNGLDSITSPGDFDGDGKPDVMARDASGNLWLFSGNGSGGFWRALPIGTGWGGMTAVVGVGSSIGRRFTESGGVGDVNNDGTRDVIAKTTAGAAYLYPGQGFGGWLSPKQLPGDWSGLNLIFGDGDLNGDGRPDVLARDTSGALWMYPGDGAGGFGARVLASTTNFSTFTKVMGAGDLNGDGFPDLLGVDAGGLLWMFPGTGTGGFGAPVQVGVGWGSMRQIISPGDFDGDGNPDLLAVDASGALLLYSGNGKASWYSSRPIGYGWLGMNSVFSPGDFDGDHIPDLIARDANGGLWLYSGDGNGGFKSVRQIGNGWNTMSVIG